MNFNSFSSLPRVPTAYISLQENSYKLPSQIEKIKVRLNKAIAWEQKHTADHCKSFKGFLIKKWHAWRGDSNYWRQELKKTENRYQQTLQSLNDIAKSCSSFKDCHPWD
jgi:hypothetical protein